MPKKVHHRQPLPRPSSALSLPQPVPHDHLPSPHRPAVQQVRASARGTVRYSTAPYGTVRCRTCCTKQQAFLCRTRLELECISFPGGPLCYTTKALAGAPHTPQRFPQLVACPGRHVTTCHGVHKNSTSVLEPGITQADTSLCHGPRNCLFASLESSFPAAVP